MEKTFTAEMTVTADKTAAAMGSGDLPVLATPAMIALMENAAMRCVQADLPSGATTVGVRMDAAHTRASAVGARITARATLTEQSGRSYTFRVEAFDEKGEIGSGTHQRVSVDREKFLARLG